MHSFLQRYYLAFRNFFYTVEHKKYGEKIAHSSYRYGLFSLIFLSWISGMGILVLILTEFGFRYKFQSENDEALWTLILAFASLITLNLISRMIYKWLVPIGEPLILLEEPVRKKYLKMYLWIVLGPLVLFFLLIFCFHFPF